MKTPVDSVRLLDSCKLKEFVDDNFDFDKNGRKKFSKLLENTVKKGEIAHHEQFLPFSQCFQKIYTPDRLKPGIAWEGVKPGMSRS